MKRRKTQMSREGSRDLRTEREGKESRTAAKMGEREIRESHTQYWRVCNRGGANVLVFRCEKNNFSQFIFSFLSLSLSVNSAPRRM